MPEWGGGGCDCHLREYIGCISTMVRLLCCLLLWYGYSIDRTTGLRYQGVSVPPPALFLHFLITFASHVRAFLDVDGVLYALLKVSCVSERFCFRRLVAEEGFCRLITLGKWG